MRRLSQFKQPLQKARAITRRSVPDRIATFPPDSVITAVTREEPLPLVMAGMSLWGIAASAMVVPLGLLAMATAPFAATWNALKPAKA